MILIVIDIAYRMQHIRIRVNRLLFKNDRVSCSFRKNRRFFGQTNPALIKFEKI